MAFQYAHHRPITPITPVHSPHPSAGSSVRTRTPGQLSLHEYRKMQGTPSPPAIPGQKTVKKKRGLSSLSRTGSLSAASPNVNFYSSFQTLTTPPETPSLAPPTGFASNVAPVDTATGPQARHSARTTYAEFEHLLAPGSEFATSPPYSPPVPSLLSSASYAPQSTSLSQPRTPSYPAATSHSPQNFDEHELPRSRSAQPFRPWTQFWDSDRRYVKLHSELSRPRSEQQAKRVDSVRAAAGSSQDLMDVPKAQPGLVHNPNQSASTEPLIFRPIARRSTNLPRSPLFSSIHDHSTDPSVAFAASRLIPEASSLSKNEAALSEPRERHFNAIKRLPRPNSSTKRRPKPLRLTSSNTDGLYQSDDNAASSSTFSLSNYPFPPAPQRTSNPPDASNRLLSSSKYASHGAEIVAAKSPSVRFSGVSFELVNPHQIPEEERLIRDEEDLAHLPPPEDLDDSSGSPTLDMSNNGDRDGPPRARRFPTYQASYENVTGTSVSRSFTTPQPGTESSGPSDWRFNERGVRESPEDRTLTPSIPAGPSAQQGDFSQVSQPSNARFARVIVPEHSRYSGQSQPRNSNPCLSTNILDHDVTGQASHKDVIVGAESSTRPQLLPDNSVESSQAAVLGGLPASPRTSSVPFRHTTQTSSGSSHLPDYYHGRAATSNVGSPAFGDCAISPLSARNRDTISSSNFDSRSVRGSLLPESGQNRHTHYSLISSLGDEAAGPPFRRSELFPYDHYTLPRGSSTLDRFIDTYGEQLTGHGCGEGAATTLGAPPDSVHDDDNDDDLYGYPLSVPDGFASSFTAPLSGNSSLPSGYNPQLSTSPAIATATNQGNGLSHGDSAQTMARIPLWRRYGLTQGSRLRNIPISELETRDDFQEAVDDMAAQPLLEERGSAYYDRADAILKRAGELFEPAQVEEWRHEIRDAYGNPHEVDAAEPAQAATRSARNIDELEEQVHRMVMASPARRAHEAHLSSVRRGKGLRLDTAGVVQSGLGTSSAAQRQQSLTGQYDDEDDWMDDEYDDLMGQEPQTNNSPLDPSPQTPFGSQLAVPGVTPYSTSQPFHALSNRSRAAEVRAQPSSRPNPFFAAGSNTSCSRSGPPPHRPAPNPLHGDRQVDLSTIPPFAPRSAFDSPDVSSYGNTGKLLQTQAPSPLRIRTNAAGFTAVDHDIRHPDTAAGAENSVPMIWQSLHPRGSGSFRPDSSRYSRHTSMPSQTSAEIAAAQNDLDEWETEPCTSKHNSTVPEHYTFPGNAVAGPSTTNTYTSWQPSSKVRRQSDSVQPGFYPPEELSSEPHDGFEHPNPPAPAAIRYGHQYEDIELAPLHSRTARPSRIQLPVRAKRRQRSEDIDGHTRSCSGNVLSPMERQSVRSSGSRHTRASVRYQTSLQPLLTSATRPRYREATPFMRKVPKEMGSGEKLFADIIIYSCITLLAPLCLPPFLFGVGVFDLFLGKRASKKMRRIALAEALFFFIVIVIAATVGITLSVRDERRANGEGY